VIRALEQTTKKTPLPTLLPFLRVGRCLAMATVSWFVSGSLPSNRSICHNIFRKSTAYTTYKSTTHGKKNIITWQVLAHLQCHDLSIRFHTDYPTLSNALLQSYKI
jgi:hypothetical protein